MKSGDRCGVNVDLKEIFYRIRKLRLITLVSCKEEPKFLPVGLGEPLCHPNMIEILTYAANFFPMIQITTNAILLTETKAKELLKINIYKIVVSLSYYDQDTYSREIGADFLIVKKNITRLFELRNKLSSKTKITVHIFDNNLNSEANRKDFKNYFSEFLKLEDCCDIRPYMEFTDNGVKGDLKKVSKDRRVPCYSLWTECMVSAEGYVFPCCMGVWKKYDETLSLGRISDSPDILFTALDKIQKVHKKGVFGTCETCPVLNVSHPYDLRAEAIEYNELLDFCKEFGRVHLYGAGYVGKIIGDFLSYHKIHIGCFFETNRSSYAELLGYPVYEFGTKQLKEDEGIIVCVSERYQKEILENLNRHNVDKSKIFFQNKYGK